MIASDVARRVGAVSALVGFKLDLYPDPPDVPEPDGNRDALELYGHQPVPAAPPPARRWPIRRVTILVPQFTRLYGAIFLLTGIAGFALGAFRGQEVTTLVIFDLNPVHSGLHTAIGAALIASTLVNDELARITCTLAGGTYLAISVVGLFLIGGGDINVLALNQADNVLHATTGLLAVYVGLTGEGEDDAIVWNNT
jgi:hypothetical protein